MLRKDQRAFTVEHFCAWAKNLVLDNGQPWIVEEFQAAFVAEVFAGYSQCWFVVPEGNTKTTLAAGLALYFAEFSPRPITIPVAASARDQAEILYRQAEGFILRSKRMHEIVTSALQKIRGKLKLKVPRFTALPGHRRIEHVSGSRIQIQAADARTGDGVIFRLAIIDELHRHRDLDLQRTWAGKIFKAGGQLVIISTAGEPGGEFETMRASIRTGAKEITRKGCFVRAASPQVVMHEWALAENGNVEDLELVKAANPFSGITVASLTAKRSDPTMTLEHWRRLTCNLPTRSGRAAIAESEWESARVNQEIPAGIPLWVGLDLGWSWDTTGIVPFWWKSFDYRQLGPATVVVPPRDGTMTNPHVIEDALIKIHQRNPIHTVVMDPSKGEQMQAWIEETFGCRVVAFDQSNPPQCNAFSRFMEGLRTGVLKHSGDQALTQHAMHAVERILPAAGSKFERPADGGRMTSSQPLRVIDALVAAAMVHSIAVGELAENYELLQSVY